MSLASVLLWKLRNAETTEYQCLSCGRTFVTVGSRDDYASHESESGYRWGWWGTPTCPKCFWACNSHKLAYKESILGVGLPEAWEPFWGYVGESADEPSDVTPCNEEAP